MTFSDSNEIRPRLKGNKRQAFENLNKKERRILIIGDLHAPFVLPEYLEHCKQTYANYNCNQVIFIGDILDNHAFSYHEPDPNGLSAGNELIKAKKYIKDWYKEFPVADVLIGNHDRMASRKAMTGGVPSAWIKSYNDVLGTPKWNWCETIVYDNVLFEHGEGGQAARKAQNNMMSSVCGHTHTSAYVQWFVGKKFKVFGMQVGCGVDSTSYAAAYARNFKKQAIGCGVVIGGHTAINSLMNL
jgi:predicted phosphodiesterase